MYVAIDFETANPKRVSACSAGGCVVEDGKIVDTFSTLIKPPAEFGEFSPFNVRIHGITSEKVADAPTFADLFPRFQARVDGHVVISYSKFDLSVINSLLDYYGCTSKFKHVDVCALAKECVPGLPNYKLPTVAQHLGLGGFNHHDAIEDAIMCAKVFLALKSSTATPCVTPSCRQQKESFSDAFSGFASVIVEDGIIDYKEAVELMHFLEVLPQLDIVVRLHQTVSDFLADGVISNDESNLLIAQLGIAAQQFSGRSYELCKTCGGPLPADMRGSCPWCLARESCDSDMSDEANSHLDAISQTLHS